MAVTATKLTPNADHVEGNRKVKVRDLVFSGNYATGGESLAASVVGLRKIETVIFTGPIRSTDSVTATIPCYDHANSKVLVYESAASAAAFIEKDNAEAYITGARVRAVITGY